MATKKDTPKDTTFVKAVCLNDCAYGLHGAVVEVAPDLAKDCTSLDTHPEAVAYAESVLVSKE